MTVEAYAKVNLTLEVLGRRVDGYHALRSVVAAVSLADTVSIEPAETLTSDVVYADDLCLRAARTLDPMRGASIRVTKRIPAGGGLGGGSADAAATLRGLNELWSLGHSAEELAEIGARVGSDVPAQVLGGLVRMEGRGEFVSSLPFVPLHLVLANPGVHSSTREVFAACRARPSSDSRVFDEMASALVTGDPVRVAAALVNDLEEPAVRLHPEIGYALARLRASGVLGAAMSGSGSTVFGIVRSGEEAARIAGALASEGLRAWAVRTVA